MTMETQKIERGKIFFIYPDAQYKTCGAEMYSGRPGIIISNDHFNKTSRCFLVVYLTTKPKMDLPTHFITHASGKNSTALCEQITSVSEERIGDYYGMLSAEEMEKLDKCLQVSVGLTDFDSSSEEDADNEETDDSEFSEFEDDDYEEENSFLQEKVRSLLTENIKVNAKLELLNSLYEQLLFKETLKV